VMSHYTSRCSDKRQIVCPGLDAQQGQVFPPLLPLCPHRVWYLPCVLSHRHSYSFSGIKRPCLVATTHLHLMAWGRIVGLTPLSYIQNMKHSFSDNLLLKKEIFMMLDFTLPPLCK
jgi:hypothetical protein